MIKKKNVKDYIRTIPDFPVPGVMFRDVTTLFNDADGFQLAIDEMTAMFRGTKVDSIVGIDARGFVLGGALAYKLHRPFTPVRKAGKLPGETIKVAYALEYGEAELEIHKDALAAGHHTLLVDDLLATGGTAEAAIKLIEQLGGHVAAATFLVDLPDLGGRKRLEGMGITVQALAAFEGE